ISEYNKVGWKLPAYHLSITNIWSFFSLPNVHYADFFSLHSPPLSFMKTMPRLFILRRAIPLELLLFSNKQRPWR
ncbi:MAG: hypothetical protein KHX29_11870, partial [Prevotella buccalis]|nr:hypothetical protein [Hoylesella buccalis]